jgi:hypothetical protein
VFQVSECVARSLLVFDDREVVNGTIAPGARGFALLGAAVVGGAVRLTIAVLVGGRGGFLEFMGFVEADGMNKRDDLNTLPILVTEPQDNPKNDEQ